MRPRPHIQLRMVRILITAARRLALKIASYGVMHLGVAILVAFAITRDWRLALAVGMVEPVFQTLAYSIHDRVWHRIERRQRLSRLEEASEAFTARLDVMAPREQMRAHGHPGHSHALPGSLKQVAAKTVTYGLMHFVVAVSVAFPDPRLAHRPGHRHDRAAGPDRVLHPARPCLDPDRGEDVRACRHQAGVIAGRPGSALNNPPSGFAPTGPNAPPAADPGPPAAGGRPTRHRPRPRRTGPDG